MSRPPAFAAVGVLLLLQGCAAARLPPCAAAAPAEGDGVWVIDHGWHTDLAIPASALRGRLASFRQVFPGLSALLVGFGRRTFMTAPVVGLSDLLVGPFPGRGVLLVAGLRAPPALAYADGRLARLPLTRQAARDLSDFVWSTFRLDHDGRPVPVADGFFPGSRFYAASIGYSGFYTCNSWTDDALHHAGLMPGPAGVVFSGQVMERAGPLCAIGAGPADPTPARLPPRR